MHIDLRALFGAMSALAKEKKHVVAKKLVDESFSELRCQRGL